jgi:hypothetical protein
VSTFFPEFGDQEYDLFISSDFKMQLPVKWYLKMQFDSFLVLLILFLWGSTAQYYSRRLFYTLTIWVLYHGVDIWMFMYNYKSTWWVYWSMLIFAMAIIIISVIPIKEKAKIVSM